MAMKAALIGYGYWGRILEKYLRDSDKFDLAVVYSPRLENRDIYTNNFTKITKDDKIEAVFICSPVLTHFSYCEMLLRLKKHVFCEKPTAKSLAEFNILNDLALNNDRILFTDYIYTVSQSINKLKEMLILAGPLTGISCKICQNGKIYKDESVYVTLGVHMIAVITYLLNQKPVNTVFFDLTNEAHGFIQMVYPENINVNIECNLLTPLKERIITIYGKNDILYFNMLEEITVQKLQRTESGLLSIENYCFDEKNNISLAIDAFRKCIEKRDCRENLDLSKNVLEILNSH
jgi:predicted dehydrogenase